MKNLFFAPDLDHGISDITLSPEESGHCKKSLRLGIGDHVGLVNGRGITADAEIISADSHACHLSVISMNVQPLPHASLHMAVAPPKNHDRFEWFCEKATEFGVDVITPLLCQRSERPRIQSARLQRILVSAMKQSGHVFLPEMKAEMKFKDFVLKSEGKQKFIAFCGETTKDHLMNVLEAAQPACILIGPEGDFTMEEMDIALQQGFRPISLGDFRLRTETAAVAACHIFNLINQGK